MRKAFVVGSLFIGFSIATTVLQNAMAGSPQLDTRRYESAETCKTCHATQHEEWKGSMMHHSAMSPVFQAFELKVRETTGRFGVHDKQDPTFCVNCHSPQASARNEMVGLLRSEPARNGMSKVAREGITCTFCHSVKGPGGLEDLERGLLGDSLANADLLFFPNAKIVGPTTTDPLPDSNRYHAEGFWTDKASSRYLASSEFCGSCHNVHLPNTPDTLTGKPFQVEQSTYTEWKNSPYSKQQGGVAPVSCNDCHMSTYGRFSQAGPSAKPGNYPLHQVAQGFDRVRKHAIHRFTAASVALVEDQDFPNQASIETDAFGLPKGQQQTRETFLRKACTLSFGQGPFELVITNSGAGHDVPTGLSQERELWLELTVRDIHGGLLFQSGTAPSSPPSKDLEDLQFELDPISMEARKVFMGPDFNLRPFADVGMPRFSNAFMRERSGGDYEHVYFFSLANHVDSGRTLPPLKPVAIRFELPDTLLRNLETAATVIKVEARLLYRSFRPRLLRALAQSPTSVLSEKNVDRNTIVEMQRVFRFVSTGKLRGLKTHSFVEQKEQYFGFRKNGRNWLGFFQPVSWEEANRNCENKGCTVPTTADYDSLGLAEYVAQPGDNKDELWKDRWASDPGEKGSAKTYRFSAGESRIQERRIGPSSLEVLSHFCVCPEVEK